MSRLLFPAIATVALVCTACGPSAPPADPRGTGPVASPSGPAPSTAASSYAAAAGQGTPVHYACGDASTISVTWGIDQAHVEFPDGRTVTLPKAQSASKGGGEVFVGDTVALQRNGDDIQLFEGEGSARQCAAQKPVE